MNQNKEFLKSIEMGKEGLEQVKFWQTKINETISELKKMVSEQELGIIQELEEAAKANNISKILEIQKRYANCK